jgi:hypothetical protein
MSFKVYEYEFSWTLITMLSYSVNQTLLFVKLYESPVKWFARTISRFAVDLRHFSIEDESRECALVQGITGRAEGRGVNVRQLLQRTYYISHG